MLIPFLLWLVLVAGQSAPHVPPPPAPQETAAAAEKTFYQDVSW